MLCMGEPSFWPRRGVPAPGGGALENFISHHLVIAQYFCKLPFGKCTATSSRAVLAGFSLPASNEIFSAVGRHALRRERGAAFGSSRGITAARGAGRAGDGPSAS
ncbi:hypothetical protein EVAR_80553_1 [Eumeta japonica]|uniref:Uncharacterized protein n=1 Tax=Eumeta variegata TaxID=151549 RepID=A0A4C1TNN0_EUMVA|nr:hypothetical protein EVAR_80553_1 [Eumeta japonica]